MDPANEFRWPAALKHVGLAVLASFGLGMGLAAFGLFPEPDAAAELFGRFLVPTVAVALAGSYARQKGRPAAFALCTVVIVLLLLFPAYAGVFWMRPPVMTPEELKDFETLGATRCQRALGLSFSDPGEGFVPDPQMQQALLDSLKKTEAVGQAWAWVDRQLGRVIVAQVVKMPAREKAFRSFVEGLRKSIVRQPGVEIEDEKLETAATPLRYAIAFMNPQGVAADTICISSLPDGKVDGVACLTTLGPHAGLSDLRRSFSFDRCGDR